MILWERCMSQMECDQFAPFTHILCYVMKLKEMLKVPMECFTFSLSPLRMNERKRKTSKKKCLSYGLISNVCDKRIHKAFLWNNFSDFSKSDNSLSIAALSYFKWIVISFTAQRVSMYVCVALCVCVGVILEIRSFKRIRNDLFSCCCLLLVLLGTARSVLLANQFVLFHFTDRFFPF